VFFWQLVIARGLFSAWKQPVNYRFDAPMCKFCLFGIIPDLHSVNYKVVANVSDMGIGNRRLIMTKNIRNHFIDQGFTIDGKYINKAEIEELIAASSDDTKIVHKVKDYHLSIRGSKR
jgi:hypothetical protein